ncbi:thioredoxin family protein [Ectothiorhodospira mobilis]|uniref:thioredoxin family protein n=1 Tax=Ectothiorhodospira mobilis TaxID=195064 RepID=UPI0030B84CB2
MMKTIQVLGSGCASCQRTHELIEQTAREQGVEVDLRKVEDMADILALGVMSTPAVAVDGTVVHSGSIPDRQTVLGWLE